MCSALLAKSSKRSGSHCVKLLLERGHTVHATVRDATNEKKTAFIRELDGWTSQPFVRPSPRSHRTDAMRPPNNSEPRVVVEKSITACVRGQGSQFHVRTLTGAAERLKLFSADLEKVGSYEEAMVGATACIHTAAMVQV